MKKNVIASLVLTGMVLGTGSSAFAAESTGYKTYDNVDGKAYDDTKGLDIPVNGTLGKMDNTNPDENLPEGDDRWLNVTIPTSVMFNTNPAKENKEIEAATYTIKNSSGRPIKVDLAKFSGSEVPAITKLSLKPTTGTAIDVVTGGKVTDKVDQLLVNKLAAKTGNYAFTYTGTVDPTLIKETPAKADEATTQKVSYTMNLKFEVLDKDGNSVTK